MSEDINNMKDSWFFDKNFNGLSDEAFDDVVKFFDFPLEDVETNVPDEDWDAQLKHLEHPSFDVFPVSLSGQFDRTQNDNLKLERSSSASVSLLPSIMCNEISPLKQLTETAEPAYGKFIPNQNVSFNGKDACQIQTYSPVSVFESSSSSSCENSLDLPVIPVKRARSKRRRLSSLRLLFSIPFFTVSPAFEKSQRTTASESDFEVDLTGKLSNKVNRKQRKKDLQQLSGPNKIKESSSQESAAPRKCTHCEVTKTPQWREGPLGSKTLCNACGVRYRSGRLFPEYRPAASPTFVSSLHSNCHKKVIEMRNRAIQEDIRGSVLTSSCNNFLENSLG